MTVKPNKWSKAKSRSVAVLFTIAILAVMVRPLPVFPNLMWEGLLFAINPAVATHLQFGRDVLFTHGPYASVYTSRYYPGIEHLRLTGQIFNALA